MQVIKGATFEDFRGIVKFVNDFDMTKVVRMYSIYPNKNVIRAWQGHKMEYKWFFVAKGAILVKVRNMLTNEVHDFHLSENEAQILEISGGNYNGFQALTEDSILIVYSNFSVKESLLDDYRQSIEAYPW
ncbi:cupin domain-containing protein [Flavobacterium branchiophilum]|uniref:Sugar 3,4-ketoisomerase QdtA cupin domain-containing protein n=1 Tax=Flavobacterium branchiophilum TaxID=55197 RepID=A0A2H3K9X7_9FLAO|nr:hypothetical protein [Flavobacterium branchiophilum]PDS23137.1 hypothetical protein B0A77_11520 [Flavobacterium branchiophilum]